MPYKGGVQLLPETQRRPTLGSYTSGNGYFYTAVVIGLAVVIIGAIFSSYKANLNEQIDKLDGQLQANESSRNKDQEKTLIGRGTSGQVMRTLLGSKVYWSQALGYMEQMMQSGIHSHTWTHRCSRGPSTYGPRRIIMHQLPSRSRHSLRVPAYRIFP